MYTQDQLTAVRQYEARVHEIIMSGIRKANAVPMPTDDPRDYDLEQKDAEVMKEE